MKKSLLMTIPVAVAAACIGYAEVKTPAAAGPTATKFPADYKLPELPRQLESTKRVHKVITERGGPNSEAEMSNYEEVVPRAGDATLKMIAIKGGEFLFGSPKDEEGRQEDEGPQRKVKIEPFWMSEVEVPWAIYQPFYQNGLARNKDGTLVGEGEEHVITVKGKNKDKAKADKLKKGDLSNVVDAVSQPTPQYHDMFLSGDFSSDPEFPAMTMTHHAASKFCQWLSAQTGHFYRLPTEAEWEYACRAGTTTAYYFGDDPSKLGDYEWFDDNSDGTYHVGRQKKPNPWGLYDMLGNVSEWTLDGHRKGFREKLQDGVLNPWCIPVTRYPRIAKGGSWYALAEESRCASRLISDNEWKDTDPQVPKSVWYHTDAQDVGLRIVRPLRTPAEEEMHLFWNSDWWDPVRNGEDL
ncbi:MAG: formylglycine-generating enzyme family protein [Akkermansiaceae bacterium]|nr:formylglycine-generating enzyme family protein [Akkermansiaceae bacterium]NNM30254.1 formylglycine-generating enzyme family protein [Akkermansiaceae bacterium]